jgi:hypothetical protein
MNIGALLMLCFRKEVARNDESNSCVKSFLPPIKKKIIARASGQLGVVSMASLGLGGSWRAWPLLARPWSGSWRGRLERGGHRHFQGQCQGGRGLSGAGADAGFVGAASGTCEKEKRTVFMCNNKWVVFNQRSTTLNPAFGFLHLKW